MQLLVDGEEVAQVAQLDRRRVSHRMSLVVDRSLSCRTPWSEARPLVPSFALHARESLPRGSAPRHSPGRKRRESNTARSGGDMHTVSITVVPARAIGITGHASLAL